MNLKNKLLGAAALVVPLVVASSVSAQSFNIEDEQVTVGTDTVTVEWQLTAGGGLQGVGVDITFDEALIDPVTDGGTPERVVDCFTNVDTQVPPACVRSGNVIRITMSNFPGTDLVDQDGSITFDIAPGASVGDSSALSLNVASAVPVGVVVAVDPGSVEIVSAPPPVFDVSPASVQFGNVRVGETSDERPIEICNNAAPGSSSLTISDITTAPAQFAEGAGSTCAATSFGLAAGECCNYHVIFSPNAEDSFTGSVAIQSNVASVSVALSGEGTVSDANLTIAPTSADFGTLDINDPAVTRDFTLQNAGSNDSLDITSTSVQPVMLRGMLVLPFDIVADTCEGQTLAPQADCLITVEFDPSEAGTFDSTLAVSSSANNVNADLTGVGTATADIVVDPPFGPVSLGFGEAGETVTRNGTVTNNGSASADVSCTLDDTTGVFSTTPSPLAATVDAGSTVDFSLSCALPDTGEEGDTYSATLTCSVDNDVVGTHDLSCGVTEFEPLPVPTMSNWSIALFALLMLLVGGISIRFFRT